MSIDLSCQASRHPHAERGLDLYSTPPCAVEALLRAEQVPLDVWECAAGRGAVVKVLRKAGHIVVASDIADHGFPLDFRRDFFDVTEAPEDVDSIVTNPPYKIAQQFVEHALDLVPRVYLLLRLAFLESERRRPILEDRGLARVHVFRKRLPMMHRDGWTGPRASSAVAFAWFVWDRDHTGPAIINRISWEAPATEKR
jgi:hypothetical protein